MSKIRHLNPGFDNLTKSLRQYLDDPHLISVAIVASTGDRVRMVSYYGPLEDLREALNAAEWEIKQAIICSKMGIEVELED